MERLSSKSGPLPIHTAILRKSVFHPVLNYVFPRVIRPFLSTLFSDILQMLGDGSLWLEFVSEADNGIYQCILSNTYGSISYTYLLTARQQGKSHS